MLKAINHEYTNIFKINLMCVANSIIVDDHSNDINNHKVIRVFAAKKGNYTANPETSGPNWAFNTKSFNLSIFKFFNL